MPVPLTPRTTAAMRLLVLSPSVPIVTIAVPGPPTGERGKVSGAKTVRTQLCTRTSCPVMLEHTLRYLQSQIVKARDVHSRTRVLIILQVMLQHHV